MNRTPALVAAAAALGLVSVLGLEARTPALTGEVSPHTVTISLLTPGAPSPAGLELDEPGARWAPPATERRLMKLPPMRARVSDEVAAQRRARTHLHRKVVTHGGGCPPKRGEQAERAALELRRS